MCMRSANDRRRYIVTSSFIGWAHTQKNPAELKAFEDSACFSLDSILSNQVIFCPCRACAKLWPYWIWMIHARGDCLESHSVGLVKLRRISAFRNRRIQIDHTVNQSILPGDTKMGSFTKGEYLNQHCNENMHTYLQRIRMISFNRALTSVAAFFKSEQWPQLLIHDDHYMATDELLCGREYTQSITYQGLYSLSGLTSYHKISRSLEAARFGFKLVLSLWNLAGTSAAPLRDACQISERYDHYNTQSRGFETSRDLAVRRLTA